MYISSYIIIYHHISSYIIIYHHISSYIIKYVIYHHISSYIIIYHHISSKTIIYHQISPYIIIYHHISSFFSPCHAFLPQRVTPPVLGGGGWGGVGCHLALRRGGRGVGAGRRRCDPQRQGGVQGGLLRRRERRDS